MIAKEVSDTVLMIGVYFKNSAPGGMAAVIQYYNRYFEHLNYVASWRLGNTFVKLKYFIFAYVQVLFQLIFNKKIKIVHIHSAADQSFWRKSIFMKLSKFFHKKVILHIHASRFKDFYQESDKKQEIIKNLLMADKLVVLSYSWKEWFVNIGIPQHQIIVLNNIVDYPQIINNRKCDNRINLLFMGEIGDRKGVFDVLKAIAISPEDYRGKMLFRIGGNRNEEKLKKCILDYNLSDIVKFEGWIANEKKIELLNWANLFILTSYNEGLPISILEAMSYKCPIISTPVGGIPEVVKNEKNGILVQPGNIKEIKKAIDLFVNNIELCKLYGEQSVNNVQPFLPKSVFASLNSIYDTLLKNK